MLLGARSSRGIRGIYFCVTIASWMSSIKALVIFSTEVNERRKYLAGGFLFSQLALLF